MFKHQSIMRALVIGSLFIFFVSCNSSSPVEIKPTQPTVLKGASTPSSCPATIADLVDSHSAFLKLDKVNTAIGAPFNMHFISTVTVGGTIKAYYIRNVGGTSQASYIPGVGLATSTDGITFTDQGTVLNVGPSGSWDGGFASFPDVYLDNGTYYMVYEGAGSSPGDLGLATSTDGVHFTKYQQTANGNSSPFFVHQTSGWESTNIGTPSLYKVGSTWYLHYHGYSAGDVQVGVATGSSLTSLTRFSGNPILPTSASGPDSGTIGRRGIIAEGGAYYMVYEVSTDAPFDQAKWSSAFARSSDLLHWTKSDQNPVLPQTNNFFGNDGPTFLKLNGTTWIYYRVVKSDNFYSQTRRAQVVSEACIGGSLQFSSTSLPHVIGRADADGWSVNTNQDSPNFMQYGPYTTQITAGNNTATWNLMVDNNTADNNSIVTLDIFDATAGSVLASRTVRRQEWTGTFSYQSFSVPFTLPSTSVGHQIELRVYWNGSSYVRERDVKVASSNSSSAFDLQWSAATQYHQIGRVEADGWSADTAQDNPGFQMYGPYTTGITQGDNIATWKLMTDNNTADNLALVRLEVVDADDNGAILSSRNITRGQFKTTQNYEYFSVPFNLGSNRTGHRIELRVFWYDHAYIRIQKVGIS